MSFPPLPPSWGKTQQQQQQLSLTVNVGRSTSDSSAPELPPFIDRSPNLTSATSSSAQRYLQYRDQKKKLFDSADYFSTSPTKRGGSKTSANAFDEVEQEAARLHLQETRPSALSFEMFNEINADDVDDVSSDEGGFDVPKAGSRNHPMRRSSVEELVVEENEHEVVKHALLTNPRLKRWDSGEFYSSPSDYRKLLATQGKDVLRQALDHAEEAHRPRRPRRSSLSISETLDGDDNNNNGEDARMAEN